MDEKKNKHLTLADKTEIQECLYRHMTFKAIADFIGKDPTTIPKKNKSHAKAHQNNGCVTLSGTCPKPLKAPCVRNGRRRKSSDSCRLKDIHIRQQ